MIALERRKHIYEIALQKGAVSVSELAVVLEAAENTIRSDLKHLEKEGKLIRSRGGALLKESGQPVLPYQQVKDANILQKSWIAEAAVKYFPVNGSVFVNAGTTTYQLALRMPERSGADMFTNSPEIAAYLVSSKHLKTSLIGGRIVPESMETDGAFSRELIENIYWDTAFVGITALDIEHGITSINIECAQMESLAIMNSKVSVGLCDSSKLGKYSRARACDINTLDILITDKDADYQKIEKITEQGVKVIAAGAGSEEVYAARSFK